MKKLLTILFIVFLPNLAISKNFLSYDTFFSIEKEMIEKSDAIIIASGRPYLHYFVNKNINNKNIYWLVPDNSVSLEELRRLKDYYAIFDLDLFINENSSLSEIKLKEINFYVIGSEDIGKIIDERVILIADLEYFFRLHPKEFPNKRGENIISFFKRFKDINLKIDKLIVVRGKDISLPQWNDENEFLLANAFDYYNKDEVPVHLITLDDTDNAINFAEWELAINVLVEIEKKMKNNPFLYKRIMLVGVRLKDIGYTLKALDLMYELSSPMAIEEGLALSEYLLNKNRVYEAYALTKFMYKKEPWNKKLKEIFYYTVEFGYFYYSEIDKNVELEEVFKEEFNNIRSRE